MAKGKSYDNDYAAILRWVTTRMREIEKEQQSYNNFKNKQKSNKNQLHFFFFKQSTSTRNAISNPKPPHKSTEPP